VAPVIGAGGEDVASSIAFTAVLGVVVVLVLPLLVPLLQMSLTQYGVMAGLTVYAVPQVLAATLPIGALSNQVGTVVKLVRVLMLGPVVLLMSLLASKLRDETDEPAPKVTAGDRPKPGKLVFHQIIPWFIVGFLVVAGIRSTGMIPNAVLHMTALIANLLTTVSMAALGLGVDIRVVAKAGLRVTGNTGWIDDARGFRAFTDYEETLSQTLSERRALVLCSYPTGGCECTRVFDVVRSHQLALVRRRGDWEVIEDAPLKTAKGALQRLNVELEDRVRLRTAELEHALRARDDFLIEGPEVFKAPAAPRDDEEIDVLN